MVKKLLKPEVQALKLAQKVDDEVFTHVFGGFGYININSDDREHPLLIVNIHEAGKIIYEAIKSHTIDYFYKSYASKYGKGVVPKECIDYAYNQCTLDDKGRLVFKIDFSSDSINRKYLGKPEVRVIDDFIFKDSKSGISPLLPSFFHLYNTRLKDEKWTLLAIDLQYKQDNNNITFDEFKEYLKTVNVL